MRQIVLDTETTGLNPQEGHRIIEIGCVELVNRKLTGKTYQCYLNPERHIDAGASKVHGIDDAFLVDKPKFKEVVDAFLDFVKGAELVIHNAPFDLGFLKYEMKWLNDKKYKALDKICDVIDTLVLAKKLHPKQRNNLDALCKRYDVTHHERDLHGALLDARILADVYLAMTGGQMEMDFGAEDNQALSTSEKTIVEQQHQKGSLRMVKATVEEMNAHGVYVDNIDQALGKHVAWSYE